MKFLLVLPARLFCYILFCISKLRRDCWLDFLFFNLLMLMLESQSAVFIMSIILFSVRVHSTTIPGLCQAILSRVARKKRCEKNLSELFTKN
jgi:hypothetical protein